MGKNFINYENYEAHKLKYGDVVALALNFSCTKKLKAIQIPYSGF
jgi:hypothetical protein